METILTLLEKGGKQCKHFWVTDPDSFGIRHICSNCGARHKGLRPPEESSAGVYSSGEIVEGILIITEWKS